MDPRRSDRAPEPEPTPRLPAWTNNRLVVGLLIAWYGVVLGAIEGRLAWYTPVWAGVLVSATITAVAYHHSLPRLARGVLVYVGKLVGLFVPVLLAAGVLLALGVFSFRAVPHVSALAGTIGIVEWAGPFLLPLVFYALLAGERSLETALLPEDSRQSGRRWSDSWLGLSRDLLRLGLYSVLFAGLFLPISAPDSSLQLGLVLVLNILLYSMVSIAAARRYSFDHSRSLTLFSGGFALFLAVFAHYGNAVMVLTLLKAGG